MRREKEHVNAQRNGKIRDGYVCQICGSQDHPEGHHVIEYQYGGAADIRNIVTVCRECHKQIHRGKIGIISI